MPLNSTRFVRAMVSEGATPDEARGVADLLAKIARKGSGYPCTISVMVGRRNCEITADVQGSALVLTRLTVLDVGHR